VNGNDTAASAAEKRRHRCCFTGHRPRSLKRPADDVKVDLENSILAAVREGYTTFLTGMGCGVDIWAGEIVLRLKATRPELHLIAVVPFPGMEEEWPANWQHRYRELLTRVDFVKFIRPGYAEGAYQERNEWMVRHASLVIAVYNGTPGGTRNTIAFAERNQVPVKLLPG